MRDIVYNIIQSKQAQFKGKILVTFQMPPFPALTSTQISLFTLHGLHTQTNCHYSFRTSKRYCHILCNFIFWPSNMRQNTTIIPQRCCTPSSTYYAYPSYRLFSTITSCCVEDRLTEFRSVTFRKRAAWNRSKQTNWNHFERKTG